VDPQFQAIAQWVLDVCDATALPATLPDDNLEVHRLWKRFSAGHLLTVAAPSQVWDADSNLVVEDVTEQLHQPAVQRTKKSFWNRRDVERVLEGKSKEFIDEFYRIDLEIQKFFSSPTTRRLPSRTKSEC
jgi:hypothetical protein